ncbi:MAG: hypothetical protein E7337_07185 [Clostridiales bacterium]|nr:hypothetical protein [Clostridiales bacterium]
MTYDQAAYCRIMLISGHAEEYDHIIENLLETQNPLSDVVLELSFCTRDRIKTLSVLNDYLSAASESDIDYNGSVFHMTLGFLNRLYAAGTLSIDALTEHMHRIAQASEHWLEDPWATMNNMWDYHLEARCGEFITLPDFTVKIERFLTFGECFDIYSMARPPKEPLLKRLFRRLKHRM